MFAPNKTSHRRRRLGLELLEDRRLLVGELIELQLDVVQGDASLVDQNRKVELFVGDEFELRVQYDDLREAPNDLGASQLLTDIAISQPDTVVPLMHQVQTFVIPPFTEGLKFSYEGNSIRDNQDGRITLIDFLRALNEFEIFNAEIDYMGDIGPTITFFELRYSAPENVNTNFPLMEIVATDADGVPTGAEVITTNIVPRLPDGSLNPDALITSLQTTFDTDFVKGTYNADSMSSTLEEVGGVRPGLPQTGSLANPFIAYGIQMRVVGGGRNVDFSVSAADNPDAILLYGADDPASDFVLLDNDAAFVANFYSPANAVDDTASLDEDGIVDIDVLDNDTGDGVVITAVGEPSSGTAIISGGLIRYSPNGNFNGSDSFEYLITDERGESSTANVVVTVNPVNDPPTIDSVADVNILEDAAEQIIELTGLSAGPNELGPVRVEVSSDNPGLIPTPSVSGDLLHPRGSAGLVEFSTDLFRVVSGSDTSAKIHVRRSLDAVGAATVLFQTLDGTAKRGNDYTRVAQILTFEDGEFFKEIDIPLLVTETASTKDFLVALSNPSPDAAIGLATSRVYIVDAETNQDTNGKLVELILTARNIEDGLIPKNEAGEIDVPVGEPFDLEIAYDDLRVNEAGQNIEQGVFQLLADIAVSQPNVLMPILNETQRFELDAAVQTQTSTGVKFSIAASPPGVTDGVLEYSVSFPNFGRGETRDEFVEWSEAEIAVVEEALTAFGYQKDQFEIYPYASENFRVLTVHWIDDNLGNVDLPNISIEIQAAGEIPTTMTEFAPFLSDGTTPNPDAIRFNLNAYSRTFNASISNPSGKKFYNNLFLSRGSFDSTSGFDEVGSLTRFSSGAGVPASTEDGLFFQPFDAFSLRVYLKSAVTDFVVSVNPGEDAEAMLLYGQDEPVPKDFVLTEEIDTNFNGTSQVIINSREVPDYLSFTPTPDQSGSATITVTAIDSGADGDFSSTADNLRSSRQFLVNVSPSPSEAKDDFFGLAFESSGSLVISKSELLSNDTLGNGESIETVTVTTDATSIAGGTITREGDSFIYTRPAGWFLGIDSFQYTLDDGGSISTATVTVLSGLDGDMLTITLEPGRDHDVTLQYVEDKLVMLDHVTEETLLNIPREYVPLNVNVLGAPQNTNRVSFHQLSPAMPVDAVTSWGYQGGSARDEISILGRDSQWAWLSSDPLVIDDVKVDLRHFTSLIDSYSMVAIEEVSVRQVNRVEIDDPYMEVGNGRVGFESLLPVNLPGVTTIAGGVIQSNTPIGLHTAESIVGDGAIEAVFAGGVGSVIQATGDLIVGNPFEADGFRTDGRLEVGANVVDLLDSNQAELGSLTTIGGAQSGTLRSDYGFILDFGDNLEGFGTIETLQGDSGGPLINNGSIVGNSSEQPITINARVKGVGTFDNVVMNGDFTPGFSPALWKSGKVAYTAQNRFEIEIGGRRAGAEFDRVEHLLATLGGTLEVKLIDGFSPALGDLFEVITSELPFEGSFSEILLPPGDNGIVIRESLDAHGLTLEAVFDLANSGGGSDAASFLEVIKSEANDYRIAGPDGSALRAEGNQFRAVVTGLKEFVAEKPWHIDRVEMQSGRTVQVATDGINQLLIEGSGWKNFVEPSDINNDQSITALDALTVINELGRRAFSDEQTAALDHPEILATGQGLFYDQNGDGKATALDALRVINQIVGEDGSGAGEGEAIPMADEPKNDQPGLEREQAWQQDSFTINLLREKIAGFGDPTEIRSQSGPSMNLEDLFYEAIGKDSTEAIDHLLNEVGIW